MTSSRSRPRTTRDAAASISNRQVLAFVGAYWMRHRRAFFAVCVLTLTWTGFDLCLPVASSHLIDTVAAAHDHAAAWRAWALFIALFGGYVAARNLAYRLWIVVSARNMEALTNEVFARVQTLETEWHAGQLGGETIRRVVRAMWGYDAVSDALMLWFGPAFIVLFGLSALMGRRDPLAGAIAFVVVALFLALNLLATVRYIRPANLRSNARDAALSGMLSDALTGNATVKSFAAEAREARRVAEATAAWRQAVLITWRRFIDMGLMQNISLLILLVGLSGAMLRAWTRGAASPGDVAFAITAFMLMSGYLKNVGENIRSLQRGLDDTSDALALQSQPAEEVAGTNRAEAAMDAGHSAHAVHTAALRGDIVFENVRFAYSAGMPPVCRELSLQVHAGETIAILGPSGTGKSTLVKLLQRLYVPQSGRISIGGVDIAALPLPVLRRAIAVAPQQPELFHRTIYENIAYGRPDASREAVIEAARTACAHAFIEQLPQGYDTPVGERGVKLSGGQRQRIALARALLADAPILVLDETTSALDMQTERDVLAAIRPRLAQRICIVITHRPSTARLAKRVLHFVDGQLHEVPPTAQGFDQTLAASADADR